ncbi:hypothetical protein LOK49_LG02G03764 [Camellia lanceoleosa]|uniref:Uncharacterized protein n=1 Tax=Camellia lanceoleosa TaxID=1840588 RepID=A0ACC0IHV4_9ERIC|nr:hypothetical protein LOK49_LG02G03764 [Camellia lanceoleosa]
MDRTATFSSLSSTPSSALVVQILCGRGNKRTKKGKRFKGSYGNLRPKKEKKVERIKDKVEFLDGYGYHGTSFEQTYRCYPASFIDKSISDSSFLGTWMFGCAGVALHLGDVLERLWREEVLAETEPKFNPFTGVGRRLDGKPLKYEPPPVSSSSGSKDKRSDVASGGGQPSTGSSSQGTTRQTQGKLVFGSNVNRTKEPQKQELTKETKQEEPSKKDEPKFQPFTGKKYSLKG